METPSLDFVEKISRFSESTLGQNGQDKVSDDPNETESDSGNSLFITQIPVPEAVRSVKRRHSRLRSDPTSPREREGSEDADPSSASPSESVLSSPVKSSKNGKTRRRETHKLKKYFFPFLRRSYYDIPKSGRERTRRGIHLTGQQNAVLQNSSVGGFFKCVKALWYSNERGSTLESFLPMVDMDEEETISPLSEEDEGSYGEDIKVVERKRFVTSSKAKCSQAWYTPSSPERTNNIHVNRAKQPRRESAKIVRRSPHKMITRKSGKLMGVQMCPGTETLVDGDSSLRGPVNREMSDEHLTSDSDFMNRTETPTAKTENGGNLSHQKIQEEMLYNHGVVTCLTDGMTQADVCHPDDPQSGQPEDGSGIRETHDPLLIFPDLMSDDVNDVARKKKKKKKKKTREKRDSGAIEEGIEFPSSREGPDDQDAGTSVDVEMGEEEETPGLSEDNGAEPLVPQSSGEMERSGKNRRKDSSSHDDKILRQEESSVELPQHKDSITQTYSSQLKEKKKKTKKKKSAADVIMTEELEEGPSQNLSFHSELVDESSSRALPQDSPVSHRQLECNVNQISVDNSVSQLENIRQEDENSSIELNVRTQEHMSHKSPVTNEGRERRKKKRKRVREDCDVIELPSDAVGGPANEDVEMQRKKKKRKKERRHEMSEKQEKELSLNLNLDPPQKFTGLLEESGSPTPTQSLENTEVSQGTLEFTIAKNSKDSIGSSVTQLEDVIEPSNDAISLTGSTGRKKRKKTSVFCVTGQDEETAISNTTEETEMNPEVKNADKSQTTTDVELVPKKKKRKKSTELSARGLPGGTVVQSDDSVSVRKKERKEANSFLVDDTVEQDAETHQETSAPSPPLVISGKSRQKRKKKLSVNTCDFETEPMENVENLEESVLGYGDVVREKKRKKEKKASSSQNSELKGHKEDFEKPNDKCQRSETTDTGVKRKKKCKKNDRELETPGVGRESAADMGCSQTDETVVLKKKKKKCKDLCSELQEITPTSAEDVESERSTPTDSSSFSHKKKSKQSSIPLDPENTCVLTAEMAHKSSYSKEMLKKTVTNVCETDMAAQAERASNNPVSNAVKVKKKKCADDVLPEGTSSSTELEPHAKKKKKKKEKEKINVVSAGPVLSESNSPPHFETLSSSDHITKKKHMKVKRRLHNPNQDFLAIDG